ncbi:MAG TPA: efflux RND transporter permease subunit [Microlunatus sp.]|nr:efflux RND transporter permease subunit [Microlunatus sp.]
MLRWIVSSGLRFGRLAIAAAIGVLGLGLYQLHGAKTDIYPEFGPTTVQVQAEALGLSAQEVEQLITVPLEQDLLNGIPWLAHIRSKSMPGLSAIDLEFEPGTDLYQARQMVQERMTQAKALPNVGTPPVMVQPTSSTSRVAMISLTSPTVSTMEMSVQARWQIRPRLMSIPGVANVSIWGQRDRQLQVQVDPDRLRTRQVTLTQLIESTGNALWVSPLSFVEASTPGTGGFVETPSQRLGVQHIQPITTAKQLADVAVEGASRHQLTIGDVATLREDHQPLIGDASLDGTSGLMLVVERFPGADTAQVTRGVEEALEAMAPGLAGITVEPTVFRPADYLTTALHDLGVVGIVALVALFAGLAVVLFSWRTAMTAAVSITVSMITAAWVLELRGETLTMITLVGIAAAVALVVDDALGDVAEIRRRLQTAGSSETTEASVVADVAVTRRGPLIAASLIVLLSLAPLLSMGGLVATFAGAAMTSFSLALAASLLVALLVTPSLAVLLMGRKDRPARPALFEHWVHGGFDRVAPAVIRRPLAVVIASVLLVAGGVAVVAVDGPGDTLPTLQDRSVVVRLEAAPGTALVEMQRVSRKVATELRSIPGVESAGAHAGRAISSDEVVDVNSAEVWLRIGEDADYRATRAAVESAVRGYPGLAATAQTYADDRVAAVSRRVGGAAEGEELVVRLSGVDFDTLRGSADEVRTLLSTVPGVLAPRVESQSSEPTVQISVDLAAAERHGLRPGDVRREASTLISGLTVGSLYEQQKIFDVVVWGGPATRQSVTSLRSLLIDTPAGGHVRLGDVARVQIAPNPAYVSHDAVSRTLDVYASVEGRDLESVSAEVTSRLRGLAMPYEYRAEVVTDAVDRQHDQRQLIGLAVVAAALSFLILQAATGSWRSATVLFVAAPVSLVGGLLIAPAMNGVTAVGVLAALVTVLALTLRQSLLLVRSARRSSPDEIARGVIEAARTLAPSVLGTALVVAAVFAAPAVLGARAGLEFLHPFAVTLLCGLVTSVAVVLLLVPTLLAAVSPQVQQIRPDPANPALDPEVP